MTGRFLQQQTNLATLIFNANPTSVADPWNSITRHCKEYQKPVGGVAKQARRVACSADYGEIVNGHALALLCAFHCLCTCPAALMMLNPPTPTHAPPFTKRLTTKATVLWLLRVGRNESKNKLILSSAPSLALHPKRLNGCR